MQRTSMRWRSAHRRPPRERATQIRAQMKEINLAAEALRWALVRGVHDKIERDTAIALVNQAMVVAFAAIQLDE